MSSPHPKQSKAPKVAEIRGMTDRLAAAYGRPSQMDVDFKRYYVEMNQPERLQLSRDEIDWFQSHSTPDRSADVVLSFGCGVQTVPHLMLTQVALFKALDIDFVATAGQAYCCGSLMRNTGRTESAARLAHTSIRRFASWQPRVNVHQCGSCYIQFSSYLDSLEAETGSTPFELVHITQFLRDTVARLGASVPWKSRPARRFLLHAEGAELHESKEQARNAIIDVLTSIPGMEYAGLMEDPSVGSPCGLGNNPRQLGPRLYGTKIKAHDDITSYEYHQIQSELEAQAKAADADLIVTPHHKCHREWTKFASERLPVVHFTSVLAEAMGIEIPDRFQILWRLGDTEKIVEMTRPNWESWDIPEARARELVKTFFVPEYAAAVQECPCNGNCFEAIISPDIAPQVSRPTL
jgi:cysteine-rich protein